MRPNSQGIHLGRSLCRRPFNGTINDKRVHNKKEVKNRVTMKAVTVDSGVLWCIESIMRLQVQN